MPTDDTSFFALARCWAVHASRRVKAGAWSVHAARLAGDGIVHIRLGPHSTILLLNVVV